MPVIRFLFLSLLFASNIMGCKKQDGGDGYYHCTEYAFLSPVRIGFVGLSSTELDTIIIKTFQSASNFSTLINTSVISDKNLIISGDSVISQIELDPNDYEVNIPATGSTYRIWNFHEGDSIVEYTSNIPCNSPNRGHHPPYRRTVDSLNINGANVCPELYIYGGYSVYLHR